MDEFGVKPCEADAKDEDGDVKRELSVAGWYWGLPQAGTGAGCIEGMPCDGTGAGCIGGMPCAGIGGGCICPI